MKYSLDQLRQVKGIGSKTIERIIEQFDESEYVSEYNPNIHIEPNSLVHGDMLEVMNGIPDKSVDMILTDLPYGTTACSWDEIIPFDKLWKQYNRVIKDDGVIVLFGSEPFSTKLRMSNIHNYKYDWVWEKPQGVDPFMSKIRPLNNIENIMIFSQGKIPYFPVLGDGKPYKVVRDRKSRVLETTGTLMTETVTVNDGVRLPKRVLKFKQERGKHPTQKPIELLEYLIKTYTNEGDLVLDSTMGSGSTCVAAKNTGRKYIGIELDKEYYDIAVKRLGDIENEQL